MNFYWFDILQFIILVFSLWCIYKFKNKWKFAPIGILALTFFFSPINMTEKNTTKRFSSTPTIIKKVEVKEQSFEERQQQKMKQLEKQSKEKLNETID